MINCSFRCYDYPYDYVNTANEEKKINQKQHYDLLSSFGPYSILKAKNCQFFYTSFSRRRQSGWFYEIMVSESS
jgi:hypothetical protein